MADTGAAHSSLASRIAALVHTYYNGLPNGSKPVVNDDGTGQWIPMSAIVLVKGGGSALWVVFGESVWNGVVLILHRLCFSCLESSRVH